MRCLWGYYCLGSPPTLVLPYPLLLSSLRLSLIFLSSEPLWPIEARNAAIANAYFVGAINRVGTVSDVKYYLGNGWSRFNFMFITQSSIAHFFWLVCIVIRTFTWQCNISYFLYVLASFIPSLAIHWAFFSGDLPKWIYFRRWKTWLATQSCTISSFVSAHPPPRENHFWEYLLSWQKSQKPAVLLAFFTGLSSVHFVLQQATNTAEGWEQNNLVPR